MLAHHFDDFFLRIYKICIKIDYRIGLKVNFYNLQTQNRPCSPIMLQSCK